MEPVEFAAYFSLGLVLAQVVTRGINWIFDMIDVAKTGQNRSDGQN